MIKVNRPEVRNALNWEAMDTFADCIEMAHKMDGLQALIITGTNHSFIAGGDLKVLHQATSEADGIRLSKTLTRALTRLEALPCPVLAAINGPARGGGAEIALACDMRIVDENADLGFVQINLGIIPGWGGSQRLLRLVGYSLAFEWLVTAKIISSQEMLIHGLANQLTPTGEALPKAIQIAQMIARQSPDAIQAIKRILRANFALPPEAAASLEQAEFGPLWASEHHMKAVNTFLNRKKSPEPRS
jgi:enoyl-CoA hydratase